MKSTESHHRMLIANLEKQLQTPSVKKTSNIIPVLHQIAEQLHKRSLVIIFSDMMESYGSQEDLFSALQHLKFNKHINQSEINKGIVEYISDFQNKNFIPKSINDYVTDVNYLGTLNGINSLRN